MIINPSKDVIISYSDQCIGKQRLNVIITYSSSVAGGGFAFEIDGKSWVLRIKYGFLWRSCNTVYGDLCRAAHIGSDFNNKKMLIRKKTNNAGYPSPFKNSVIRDTTTKR